MSELKVIDVDKMADVRSLSGQFYRKSEADKYINLLKDKANYNEFAYKLKSEELADTCRFYEDELRRQKHKRCLSCRHEGKICMRQGWGGDEYWCECKQGMSERDRRSFGCEKWEAK